MPSPSMVRSSAVRATPAAESKAMAMALMATFYGLILANMVAGPIAARLAQLSETEIGWQREIIERMLVVGRAEMNAAAGMQRQPDVVRPRQNAVRAAA